MKCLKRSYFVPKDSIGIKNSKEYGSSYALLAIARALEMDKIIYSAKKQWREDDPGYFRSKDLAKT